MDVSRIAKILEIAARETTPEGERLAALSRAHKILAQEGKTFPDIIGMGVQPLFPPDFKVPFPEWQRRVQERDAKLAEKDVELAKLRKDLTAMRRRVETAEQDAKTARGRPKANDAPDLSFATFLGVAISRLGTDRWRAPFEDQSKISAAEIDRWRTQGHVPKEAMEFARKLKPVQAKPPAPKAAYRTGVKSRAKGDGTVANRAYQRIQGAMPDGLPHSKLDGNMIRRVKEMQDRRQVYRQGDRWYIVTNPDEAKVRPLGAFEHRMVSLLIDNDGMTTRALEEAFSNQSAQERTRDLKKRGLIEQDQDGVWVVTEWGRKVHGVTEEKAAA